MFVRSAGGRELAWQYRNVRVDEPGQPSYVLGHAQDVTELRDVQEQLRQLAMTDDLTALHNRRGFFINGMRLLVDVVRQEKGAALFYVDIDGLKRINDTYGHDAGSALIVSTADVLKNSFRAADVLARIGGDEFVALAHLHSELDVETLCARLREHLRDFNAARTRPYEVDLSIGATLVDDPADQNLEEFIARADAAMYRDKRASDRQS
jgi:diguanylate cyclase (GGDEF)-like protein